MSDPASPSPRTLLAVFAGVAALPLLIAAIALVLWVTGSGGGGTKGPVPDGPTPARAGDARGTGGGKRFTLRLGQGFRFRDGAVVNRKDEQPDIVFRYLPPQVGGLSLRYNPVSQQVETGFEPTLTAAIPLLVAAHIRAFEQKPDAAHITTGDLASYADSASLGLKTRTMLLQSQTGEPYLLTLDELEAVAGKFDDWRVGFAYEEVRLPLGLAGGTINKPLSGRLIFRDWYREKMIMRVDLATGKEEAIADGVLPSTVDDRLLGYADSSNAYIVRDATGQTLHTIRFNEQVLGPLLSPDGSRLLGSVYRPGPETKLTNITIPGSPTISVGVFDLEGRETFAIIGYDDATWTPDGKVVATGPLTASGLFEIDPATKGVRPIDATINAPYQPCVSPDGKSVAFVTGDRAWLIDRDGKNLRQVFKHGMKQQRPSFSPDGTQVAIVICNQMAVDTSGDVFVVDLATMEPIPVRTNTGLSLVPDPTTRLNWIR